MVCSGVFGLMCFVALLLVGVFQLILTAIYYAFVTIVFVCVWYFSLFVWYLVPL